jgi:hypothetical protein
MSIGRKMLNPQCLKTCPICSIGTPIVKIAEDEEGWSLQVQLQKMKKKEEEEEEVRSLQSHVEVEEWKPY